MERVLVIKEDLKKKVTGADDVFKRVKKVKGIDWAQENFIVLFLDTRNIVLGSEVVFKGGLNECSIDPKTIFRKALVCNANSIIIAHNHPSGYLEPSNEDWVVYERIKKAGELISIKVLDSVIFNKTEYYSMERA